MLKKIVTLTTLNKKLERLRKNRRTIVFTNGCFDILHFGHVRYLEKAKKRARVLVLGINSDSSIRKIKGASRPIVKQDHRAGLLAFLECVDFVTIFDEETPLELIKAVRPDILVKGADWKGKGIVGEDVVKGYGGKVEYIEFLEGLSTTSIINKVLQTQ